jgi:hypothetical protein
MSHRTALACLVAPLSVPAALALLWPPDPLTLCLGGLLSYAAFLALGVPYVALLRSFRALSAATLTLGGAVLGIPFLALVFALFSLALGSSGTLPVHELWQGALLGALVAGTFSVVAGLPLVAPRTSA